MRRLSIWTRDRGDFVDETHAANLWPNVWRILDAEVQRTTSSSMSSPNERHQHWRDGFGIDADPVAELLIAQSALLTAEYHRPVQVVYICQAHIPQSHRQLFS